MTELEIITLSIVLLITTCFSILTTALCIYAIYETFAVKHVKQLLTPDGCSRAYPVFAFVLLTTAFLQWSYVSNINPESTHIPILFYNWLVCGKLLIVCTIAVWYVLDTFWLIYSFHKKKPDDFKSD